VDVTCHDAPREDGHDAGIAGASRWLEEAACIVGVATDDAPRACLL
jgi:hypothetical protein